MIQSGKRVNVQFNKCVTSNVSKKRKFIKQVSSLNTKAAIVDTIVQVSQMTLNNTNTLVPTAGILAEPESNPARPVAKLIVQPLNNNYTLPGRRSSYNKAICCHLNIGVT